MCKSGSTGPICKLIEKVNDLEVIFKFEAFSQKNSEIKCGTICQSRRGTTGEALMMTLINYHGLEVEDYRKLIVLVTCCVNGYLKIITHLAPSL